MVLRLNGNFKPPKPCACRSGCKTKKVISYHFYLITLHCTHSGLTRFLLFGPDAGRFTISQALYDFFKSFRGPLDNIPEVS